MSAGRAPAVVLALNSGSSSLKFGLFRVDGRTTQTLLSGEAQGIGDAEGEVAARDAQGNSILAETATALTDEVSLDRILALLKRQSLPSPAAIAHRLVHGGPHLRQHCRIDAAVLAQLKAAAAFAPLHIPRALQVIAQAQAGFPDLPQIACLDTAFHANLPDRARTLPIAGELQGQEIERYGFHGLSCEAILHRLGPERPSRIIVAHLGNGASVTAIGAGRSVDTSMGLTPSGGVIMGTRSGDLDPGVLIYLLRARKFDARRLEDMIDGRSGLLGISGLSHDIRRLRAVPDNARARLAIEMFCISVAKQIAAMMVALGGADLVVFTGGIGEHDAPSRLAICRALDWAGIALDDDRNRAGTSPISAPVSRCRVEIIPTEEEAQMARDTLGVLAG